MQTQSFFFTVIQPYKPYPSLPFSTSCPSLEKLDVVVDVQFFPTCDMLACSIM